MARLYRVGGRTYTSPPKTAPSTSSGGTSYQQNPADKDAGIDASKTTYDQATGRESTIVKDGVTYNISYEGGVRKETPVTQTTQTYQANPADKAGGIDASKQAQNVVAQQTATRKQVEIAQRYYAAAQRGDTKEQQALQTEYGKLRGETLKSASEKKFKKDIQNQGLTLTSSGTISIQTAGDWIKYARYKGWTDKEFIEKLRTYNPETAGDWVKLAREKGWNESELRREMRKTYEPLEATTEYLKKEGAAGVLGARQDPYTKEQLKYKAALERSGSRYAKIEKVKEVVARGVPIKELGKGYKTFSDLAAKGGETVGLYGEVLGTTKTYKKAVPATTRSSGKFTVYDAFAKVKQSDKMQKHFPRLTKALPTTPKTFVSNVLQPGTEFVTAAYLFSKGYKYLPSPVRATISGGLVGKGGYDIVKGKTIEEKVVGGLTAGIGLYGLKQEGGKLIKKSVSFEGTTKQKWNIYGDQKFTRATTKGDFEGKLVTKYQIKRPRLVPTRESAYLKRGGGTFSEAFVKPSKPVKVSYDSSRVQWRGGTTTLFTKKLPATAQVSYVGTRSKFDIGIKATIKPSKGKPYEFAGKGYGKVSGQKGAEVYDLIFTRGKELGYTRGLRGYKVKPYPDPAAIVSKGGQQIISQRGGYKIESISKMRKPVYSTVKKGIKYPEVPKQFSKALKLEFDYPRGTYMGSSDIGAYSVVRKEPVFVKFKSSQLRYQYAYDTKLGVDKLFPKRGTIIEEVPIWGYQEKGVKAGLGYTEPLKVGKVQTQKMLQGLLPKKYLVPSSQYLGVNVLSPSSIVTVEPKLKPSTSYVYQSGSAAKSYLETAYRTIPTKPEGDLVGLGLAGLTGLKPKSSPLTEPDIKVQPSYKFEIKPDLQPVEEPIVREWIEPVLDPIIEPVVKPYTRSGLKPSLQPALKASIKPAIKTTLQPALKSTLQPSMTFGFVPPPTVPQLTFPEFEFKKEPRFQFVPRVPRRAKAYYTPTLIGSFLPKIPASKKLAEQTYTGIMPRAWLEFPTKKKRRRRYYGF